MSFSSSTIHFHCIYNPNHTAFDKDDIVTIQFIEDNKYKVIRRFGNSKERSMTSLLNKEQLIRWFNLFINLLGNDGDPIVSLQADFNLFPSLLIRQADLLSSIELLTDALNLTIQVWDKEEKEMYEDMPDLIPILSAPSSPKRFQNPIEPSFNSPIMCGSLKPMVWDKEEKEMFEDMPDLIPILSAPSSPNCKIIYSDKPVPPAPKRSREIYKSDIPPPPIRSLRSVWNDYVMDGPPSPTDSG